MVAHAPTLLACAACSAAKLQDKAGVRIGYAGALEMLCCVEWLLYKCRRMIYHRLDHVGLADDWLMV